MDNKRFDPLKDEQLKDLQKKTAEVRAEYPELPQEIQDKIKLAISQKISFEIEDLPLLHELSEEVITIAHTYYNSIIEGKDKEIGEAVSLLAQNMGSIYALKLKIANQKVEIERITELLKRSVKRNIKNLIQDGRMPNEFVEKAENQEWNIYKKEHNL